MTIPGLPPRSLAFVILRHMAGPEWTQEKLAAASGRSADTLSDYERGRAEPPMSTLQQLGQAMGFSASTVQLVVLSANEIRGWIKGRGGDRKRELAAQAGRQVEALMLAAFTRLEEEDERQQARELWNDIRDQDAAERRRFFEAVPELHSWAVVEVLCAESVRQAAHSAPAAREFAELALWIAGQLDASIRPQAQGYAWGIVANARRVAGDLPQAEEGFDLAEGLWPPDQDQACPLNRSRLLDLKASLRRDQRRPLEALDLLERAARTPNLTPIARARLLINKANTLEMLGEHEQALAALREAAPAVADGQEPHLLWLVRFGLAVNLCSLGRAEEVSETLLPAVRLLAAQEENGLAALRLRWLESKVAAGLGRTEEAIVALSRVRAAFADLNMDSDAALATSELAVLYLEVGRTAEVKALVRQSVPIFHAKGILPEERKALVVFREAVERETVTLDLARRLVAYLRRVRYDSSIVFEP